ncbi:sirohydrochlorin chelatase [Arthrobacter sp. H14-L1]|uniref:sirohydrochlorin chelatase n=1 Tax=Arthrobacter sp. H14-L1 TaxID=2996697 RepID=UPI0022711EEF|nr:sirohydrochlorin chelatase [Arthrobacter sp. H14-L1]MCY0903941.1 sirohydrochlorin chelatase [Arthrobacter sp. H14-L1]
MTSATATAAPTPAPAAPTPSPAAPTPQPVLIACAHGTRSPEGQGCIDALRAEIAAQRPGLTVLAAYVDVQEPALPDVVAGLPAGTRAVVVPLLLSVGFHVRVDIAQAVAGREELTAAGPLGPDPRLAKLLYDRLPAGSSEHGGDRERGIVLAAAGSSDPAAALSVEAVAEALRHLTDRAVLAGYGAGADPTVAAAVTALRSQGSSSIAIASYLLAPGFFHDQLAGAGADCVAAPLLPAGTAVLARIALDRFDQAAQSEAGPTHS